MFHIYRQRVINKYSAQWATLDPAHRLEHFDNVFQTALKILEDVPEIKPKVSLNEVFVASYFHDLFTWSRDNHHELAHKFIITTACPIVCELLSDKHARMRVAMACLEHRASWGSEPSSTLSALISAADRGIPKTADTLLQRSMVYTRANQPTLSEAEVRLISVLHVKEKYGRNGYARIPKFHLQAYQTEYENLWLDIDALV